MAGSRVSPDEGLGPLQRPLAELCCVNPECPDNGDGRPCPDRQARTASQSLQALAHGRRLGPARK